MPSYTAPLRDMRFVLYEFADFARLQTLPGCGDFGPDLVDPVLDAAGQLCAEVLFPLNRSGDEEGCSIENGVVRTPKGFQEAYRAFREGGWTALQCHPEWGGQGLPAAVSTLFQEMMCSSNLAFGMCPGLSHGAYSTIRAHAADDLKSRYLPKIVDGTWAATMCLTEPHCGTDLGLLRTRAVPVGDGSYRVTGTKIFISFGEHDLTENIIHLVLARLPDAPSGSRGISLFLVPKFLPDADGNPGLRNELACASIEHKMGIKASPTCVMNFDGAIGWLVGETHRGLPALFTMMNEARILVGMQGLGLAEVSYQNALAYARERRQGRAAGGARDPQASADPIIVHPDVRRMLLTMRAHIEGCRALAVEVALAIDTAERHPDAATRQEAEDFVALMTPIIKAFTTDMGWDMTATGMQVLGGHGYVREWGMEQYVRDARIAQIYEGTNGIQALDLVGRKLPAHGGRALRRFFHPVQAWLDAHAEDKAMAEFAQPLARAFGRLQKATAEIARRGLADPFEAGAAATDYLRLFGLVALGHVWGRTAAIAAPRAEADAFYRAKLLTARFFMERILPQTSGLAQAISAGGATMKTFEDALF